MKPIPATETGRALAKQNKLWLAAISMDGRFLKENRVSMVGAMSPRIAKQLLRLIKAWIKEQK